MASKTAVASKQQTELSAVERLLVPQQQLAARRVDSFLLVKKLVAIGVSSIAYFRMLFPKNCFNDFNLDGQNLHLLKKGGNLGSTKLVSLLQSTYEAIDKKYIYFNAQEPDVVSESYTFSFVYHGEDVICDFYNKNKCYCTSSSYAATSEASKNLLSKIQEILSCLPNLPDECYFRLKLGYYSGTPKDYEPSGFQPAKSIGFRFKERSGALPLGSVDTAVNSVKMSMQAVASCWKAVEESSGLPKDLIMEEDILKDFDASGVQMQEQPATEKAPEALKRSQPTISASDMPSNALQSIENDEQVQSKRRRISREPAPENQLEKNIETLSGISISKENFESQPTGRITSSPSNLETIEETSPMSEVSFNTRPTTEKVDKSKKDEKNFSQQVNTNILGNSQEVGRKSGPKSRILKSDTQEEEILPSKRRRTKRGASKIIDSDEETENEMATSTALADNKKELQKQTGNGAESEALEKTSPLMDLSFEKSESDKGNNSEKNGGSEKDVDEMDIHCPCGMQEMETVMIACAECGKYGHLSCYGYPSEASVPEVVVCYYCCGELDEDEAPECSIDPGLSENEAQYFCQFRQAILFASEGSTITAANIAERLCVNLRRARQLLNRLIKEDFVEKNPVKPRSKEHEVNLSVLATEGIRKYYVGLSDQEMVLGAEFSQNSDKEMEEGSGDGNENADELPESVDIANKTRSLSLGSSEIQSSKTSTNEKKQSQKLNEVKSAKKDTLAPESENLASQKASDNRTPMFMKTAPSAARRKSSKK